MEAILKKMHCFCALIAIYTFCWLNVANADDFSLRSFAPDYLKVQAAGNIGMLAFGVGKQFKNNRVDADVWYGFVPAAQGGIDIHTFAMKAHVQFIEFPSGRLYAGSTLLHVVGKQYYASRFEKGDRDYYPWTAVHLMPYLGGRFENKRPDGRVQGMYIEMGALDSYVLQYVRNLKTMNVSEVFNLSVGIFHHF